MKGTAEKFIGDAVMAVFGLSVVHEDDALRAVGAALDLREAVAALNVELERDLGVTIQTRTGINSGEVVSGDPSHGERLVTGYVVNVAKRLEESAGSGESSSAQRPTAWSATRSSRKPRRRPAICPQRHDVARRNAPVRRG